MQRNIYYSDKYYDDEYEYRHVVLPKEMVKLVPKTHLMSEEEWRGIGVQQSKGWVHYMTHSPGIKWKRSKKYRNRVSFMSPNSSWERDGTIIVLLKVSRCSHHLNVKSQSHFFQCHCYLIFVFTLDENCTNLYKGLTETSLIGYKSENTTFFCVHKKHIPTVIRVVDNKNLKISQSEVPYLMYAASPEEVGKFAITCPPDVHVKKLDPSLGEQINSVWPHKFPGSEGFVSDLIEINGGYGLFLKGSDEPVAWVLKHCFGQVGMLQTDDNHKRKGYASLVLKALAKEMGGEGLWPFGTVLADNSASVGMFQRLGFRNVGTFAYINQGYYWRDYTGSIPADAVVGGKDINSRDIYIGQAYDRSMGLIAVQINPGEKEVAIPLNGVVRKVHNHVKILCGPLNNFYWLAANATALNSIVGSKQPVIGGHVDGGGQLNIGRISYRSETKIGRILAYNVGKAFFYFHNDGKEGANVNSYEILLYGADVNNDIRSENFKPY
ncbi:CKS, FR47, and/or Acetyltransf 1 domain containing protein [Asbolus verrucosus]|uniref:Cyclin-dependent kinases regulatory subunit n=1 Tax=Asbolus verrucosus TaxID=1661398 RepID=A0A482VMP4_ASBVE|nr:CKS, FR47, and/or Acetyltransf 1 domain containing protein [Asbolus verrucosus]